MKELIERLRYPVLCTLTDRIEAADALERLTLERNELRAKYDEVEAAAAEAESCMHYRGVALERLTAERDAAKDEIERLTEHDQFLADANKQWVADCARLTAELNSIKEKNAPEIEKCNSYIANLTAERDALRADAERYRFIFAESDRVDPVCAVVWKKGNVRNSSEWVSSVGGEWLSKELDAAIAGEKK